MVTAGVYLIARMLPALRPGAHGRRRRAVIGTATLVFAATIALVQTDLKRVIAYSTMSQIGYMVLGVSVAAYGAGLFHLMTHAFFKALLFMGAGSVIGAMAGIQNMDRMGGFRKAMPFTFITFTIGARSRWRASRSRRAGSRRTRSSPTRSTAAAASSCSGSPATWARR